MAFILAISSLASSCRMLMASSMVTMPTSRFSASTTGMARKPYFSNRWETSSWSVVVVTLTTLVSIRSRMGSAVSLASTSARSDTTPTSLRLPSVT